MYCPIPLRNSTVGVTRFLKFPRFFFLLLTPLLPTKTILDSTTRKAAEIKYHQIQSSSPYTSSPSHTLQKTYSGFSSDSDDSSDVNVLHGRAIKSGFVQNQKFLNHLLNLYVKSRNFVRARKMFDEMPDRDVQTWTILIKGFAQVGLFEIALDLFIDMQTEGIYPNRFTLSCILKCCASIVNLKMGKGIHGWILRNGVELDVFSENSIIDFYVKCRVFYYASRVFELMNERDTVSWNIMIGAYLQIGDTEKSIELFRRLPVKDVASWNTIIVGQMRNGFNRIALDLLYQMRENRTVFNEITFSTALLLAASLSMLELGRQIHSRLLRIGFFQDTFIRNSLIDMYCKCGEMRKASSLFNKMHRNSDEMQYSVKSQMVNTVSWSSIVSGYVQNGKIEEAFELFRKMVREGVEVDQFTLTSIVSACADAGISEQGRQIHAFIKKLGHKFDVFLVSAIIDMYAKCGSFDDALSIFYQSSRRNIVSWTSLISGCALHGQGREVIRLFELMLKDGIRPNEITFLGVLSGCSHAGLVEEGHEYFRLMQEDYGITSGVEHFTCMVDLLGRAGKLNEAKEFIHNNNISHLSPVWNAFLAACRVHKNIEMATWASKKLLLLEPNEAGSYVLLSNISTENQRWKEAAGMRSLMQNRGVKKNPGQSWIQLKN
ncbi:Pentatricopeptide repeat [Macleaya cordata]|uniref:Pentatricopeptide repeat n=1 Tax=Macleaya cordata TaxID=56857 RepID=A0A200R8Q7_MACCD|nr:Pentatricopeptide repeat [Macleaya cordata]